eukprot:TRINITY_DN1563_c0_g4_i3.p1 TRINITY_DN1563_c0_g4~~TRINITY_DN1563_c0_g4_i3.p1  ORF type:complete len:311 (-),score=106.52 TRINITY_DN1563_c0_g4_i3:49-981(-)
MGSCCSSEGNRVDENQQSTDVNLIKSKGTEDHTYNAEVEYRGGERKPAPAINTNYPNAHYDQPADTRSDEETFKEEVRKLDLGNETTKELYSKYGHYPYNSNPGDGIKRLLKSLRVVENDSQYYGFWNKDTDERDGNGVMIWIDGSRYDGTWKENKASGRGRLIHADGDVYDGEWKDDKAHGKGKYTHQDGALYEGDWVEDKQHGYGVETWPDGSCYEGQYVDGKKEGRGKFVWADGSEYQGEFVANNIQGRGTYKWSDGRSYEGDWIDNKMHGKGTFKWPDGKKYVGDYIEDKKAVSYTHLTLPTICSV